MLLPSDSTNPFSASKDAVLTVCFVKTIRTCLILSPQVSWVPLLCHQVPLEPGLLNVFAMPDLQVFQMYLQNSGPAKKVCSAADVVGIAGVG